MLKKEVDCKRENSDSRFGKGKNRKILSIDPHTCVVVFFFFFLVTGEKKERTNGKTGKTKVGLSA